MDITQFITYQMNGLAELVPTFIKVGQILSTRADLVGPSLAKELSELQSDSPANPLVMVRRVVIFELGPPVGSFC